MHASAMSPSPARGPRRLAWTFYRDVLEMSIADRPMPQGFPRAAIGSFVDGAWCLHFFQATAEQ